MSTHIHVHIKLKTSKYTEVYKNICQYNYFCAFQYVLVSLDDSDVTASDKMRVNPPTEGGGGDHHEVQRLLSQMKTGLSTSLWRTSASQIAQRRYCCHSNSCHSNIRYSKSCHCYGCHDNRDIFSSWQSFKVSVWGTSKRWREEWYWLSIAWRWLPCLSWERRGRNT